MGTDKAFLRIGNEFLIERQLRCLAEAGAQDLLISGKTGADYSQFSGRVVYDEQHESGPLAGIAAVLRASTYSLVFVLAVDMPAMTPVMLKKVIWHCTEASGCVPVDQYRFQPLAAAYPTKLLATAERRVREGRLSMHEFVTEAAKEGFVRPLLIKAQEQPCFLNWNEPADLLDH